MKRGMDALDALNIIGSEEKRKMVQVLKNMFDDYQRNGKINKLINYEITQASIRKIVGSGVLVKMTSNRRGMYYGWNGGDTPSFLELADKVLDFSSHTWSKKDESKSSFISKLTLLLYKNGIPEEKIPDLNQEIIKIFFPE